MTEKKVEVVVLRLSYGEEIIGTVVSQDSRGVVLDKIMGVVYIPQGQGPQGQSKLGWTFVPYSPLTDDVKEFDIDHITYAAAPKDVLLQAYQQANSMIAQPPPKTLIVD